MAQRFPRPAWLSRRSKPFILAIALAGLGLIPLVSHAQQVAGEQALALSPYAAYYRMHHNGLSADAKRSLHDEGNGRWRLSQKAKLFFVQVSEESRLRETEAGLESLSYDYENSISSRQNQQIRFDRKQQRVSDSVYRKPWQIPLEPQYTDQLSAQLQMRLALLEGSFGETLEQTILHKGKKKTYLLEKLGEELLDTPAGKLNTLKLRRYRKDRPDDKDSAMLIWLAIDWQYLIVRLEDREDDELFILELLNAQLNGQAVGTT